MRILFTSGDSNLSNYEIFTSHFFKPYFDENCFSLRISIRCYLQLIDFWHFAIMCCIWSENDDRCRLIRQPWKFFKDLIKLMPDICWIFIESTFHRLGVRAIQLTMAKNFPLISIYFYLSYYYFCNLEVGLIHLHPHFS